MSEIDSLSDSNNNNITSTHSIIHKSQLAILKRKAANYDTLMKHLSNPQYVGHNVGNSMIGFAASLVPQCGYYMLSSIIPFIIGSVFANGNIPIDSNLLVNSQPTRNTIQRLVEQKRLIQSC